ncbi:N-acetylmuramoyl-L-alanine amidase, partial [bacterium]|nr:N-acetylmuramoyl-L-alanine amidase [bacterium]
KFPIGESNFDVSGIYKGIYKIKDNDKLKNSRIKVTLVNKRLKKKVSKYAKGRISRFNNDIPYSVEVSTDNAVIKAGPRLSINNNAGYMLFPYIATKLKIIGEIGNEYKIYLNTKREGWIDKDKVSPLPLGTAIHDCIAGSVFIGINNDKNTIVRINLDERVPYEVKTDINGEVIDISLFGVISDTSWVKYSTTSTIVNQTQWFQDDIETYRLRVYTPKNSWWGYDARYEETDFVLELCSPPILKTTHVLEGIRVAVDAGHCPDTGAIGPTGLLEKDINWIIAQRLKKLLIQEKAEVIMIRKGLDESVSLYERPRRAWNARADILISVHNNALPDGKNPFEENGYGIYYFHPHSYNLAEEILKAYDEVIGENSTSLYSLRNDGLHYGNLALVRPSQMPTVLTESVYMMIPEEEALLKTEEFQEACARAMLLGLKRYMKKMRK